jgi:hypothetical protein
VTGKKVMLSWALASDVDEGSQATVQRGKLLFWIGEEVNSIVLI